MKGSLEAAAAYCEASPGCDTSPRTTWQRTAFNVADVAAVLADPAHGLVWG